MCINPYNALQNEYRHYHITAGHNARGQSTNDTGTFASIIIILIITVFVVAISVPIDVLGSSRRYWAGTHWEGLTVNGGCSAFRTKSYTAELVNTPVGDNPVTACGQTALFIHGRTLLPTYCTIKVRSVFYWLELNYMLLVRTKRTGSGAHGSWMTNLLV